MSADKKRERARDMEVYAAMVDYMDEQIGRVIDHLKETGEYENTLILFFSDNGANGALPTAYPGQTEEYLNSFDNSLENRGLVNSFIEQGPGWAQASMSPSRMFKAFTVRGRDPLALSGQSSRPTHECRYHESLVLPRARHNAHHSRFRRCPTPSEIGGRKVRPLQGNSVLDLFVGKTQAAYAGADEVGYELFGLKAYFAGDWKILWMPEPFGTGEWELFDLKQDPAEMNDLSEQHPARLEADDCGAGSSTRKTTAFWISPVHRLLHLLPMARLLSFGKAHEFRGPNKTPFRRTRRTDVPIDQKINYLELPARDLDAIQGFYEAAFGWSFTDYGPEYKAFNDGFIDGGFYKSDRASSTSNGAALIVIYAKDLERTRDTVLRGGGAIVKDVFSFPGGRRFHFADPNGNELAVWSDGQAEGDA